jgi:hypothetical protein
MERYSYVRGTAWFIGVRVPGSHRRGSECERRCDPGTRSGATDAPSDEPSRSPDGLAVIAELRARATRESHSAFNAHAERHRAMSSAEDSYYFARWAALLDVLAWLDELSVCDTESQREAGTPNT